MQTPSDGRRASKRTPLSKIDFNEEALLLGKEIAASVALGNQVFLEQTALEIMWPTGTDWDQKLLIVHRFAGHFSVAVSARSDGGYLFHKRPMGASKARTNLENGN